MSTTPQKRIIAYECHKKKVRCSGLGPPCSTCADLKLECVYPQRDRKTKVSQRHLEKLEAENKRLAALVSSLSTPGATPAADQSAVEPRADNADRNPLIEERPWFVSFKNVDLPIHIGEAADAAFATRLRQAASSTPVSHLPRVHYMSDDALRAFADTPTDFPSASRLQFLIDVALKTMSNKWHISRRSVVLEDVRKLTHDVSSCDWLTRCRIWALLAIGEAFSSRCVLPGEQFPGARYWARAMQMAHMPCERPKLDLVEVYLLMSFYASSMNRRHTAILLASRALRLCIILGLHIEIGETQLRDPAMREHRCRLWWTAYRFDRLWASKIGWPPSIPDDSIEIGLPSDEGLSPEVQSDFGDIDYMIMSVRLARMLNHAVNTLYVRKRQPTSFSERVQVAVRALRDWSDGLPEHLQLGEGDIATNPESHVLYLHLAFNQAVTVTTRPILLHLLRQRRPRLSHDNTPQQTFSDSALSLTTACIRCARQSMSLLKRAWAEGTFPTFDYFHMQFLFSSATILVLSALLQNSGWASDREDFLLAGSFLQQLERNGNFGAKEFCTHVEALKVTLHENIDAANGPEPAGPVVSNTSDMPTPSVPLPNPPLQDFLNHPEIELDFMDTGGTWIDWQDVFWPEVELPPA
ncbi:hypothetical protein Slin14017_G050000 [Septoria linicola]|nr:hypothetical protein Slin14017_G050000 [Septoria linicola]